MYRDITSKLMDWKSNQDRKPLIITGVRQCGKTYSMKEFGNKFYDDVAYFNFEEDNIARYFEDDLKVSRIVNSLGIYRRRRIDGRTLLIFDEIQNCPRAISSLKYFCEDGHYNVMCAGSLLGVKLMESSPPIGKVDEIVMYPMSFREFLLASGEEMLVDGLEKEDPFGQTISDFEGRLSDLYMEYLAIGGLPEVVKTWVETHDCDKVDSLLKRMRAYYINDIARYGTGKVRENGELVWNSIPSQLSRDNSKFVLGHVKDGLRARDLWSSVDWLTRAGLVHSVPISTGDCDVPSFTSDPSAFKLYCFDTGMLRILAGVSIQYVLGYGDMNGLYRGAVTENYVLLELRKLSDDGIFCWRSGNRAEVDFLVRVDGHYVPIEVKSGKSIVARSLGVYMDSHEGRGVVVSMNLPKSKGRVVHIPLYALWILDRFLECSGEP